MNLNKNETQERYSHTLYLQIQLHGGFWDTCQQTSEKQYQENITIWDTEIERLKNLGFKVRILGIIVEETRIVTDL